MKNGFPLLAKNNNMVINRITGEVNIKRTKAPMISNILLVIILYTVYQTKL
ncbi:hypothetical protein TASI_0385 [Taylorella asinigenitalis MCE3]|uniref:Uncharacterized protein n=1 Tax=Taylorella asinigenitalis (strain MCE3) TaxID=1008459 RepID=G4QCN1_TAYAM|nr:hypothetical protein TASI_0385 [Taylorella asinigenitalis MCE3]